MTTEQMMDAVLVRARQRAADRDATQLVVLMDYSDERGLRILDEAAADDCELDAFDARIVAVVHPDGTVE